MEYSDSRYYYHLRTECSHLSRDITVLLKQVNTCKGEVLVLLQDPVMVWEADAMHDHIQTLYAAVKGLKQQRQELMDEALALKARDKVKWW